VALDVVGGSTFMHLIGALRQGGRYSASGAISGPMAQFDLRQMIYKDLQLTGATIVPPGPCSVSSGSSSRGLCGPCWPSALRCAISLERRKCSWRSSMSATSSSR